MIKVEMGVNNDGYAIRLNPCDRAQRLPERSLTRNTKHRGVLCGPLLSDSRFDQYAFLTRVNEHAIHVHGYAVVFIRRANLRPQGARHNTKHCATIKAKFGVGNDLHTVIAKLHFGLLPNCYLLAKPISFSLEPRASARGDFPLARPIAAVRIVPVL